MVKELKEEVTTPEAARYIGVSASHIRLLFYRKVLRGEKRGRDIWITVESLEEYQKNRPPAGRPEGTVSSEPSKNKRGEREREYQREYKRKLRKGQRQEASPSKATSGNGRKGSNRQKS